MLPDGAKHQETTKSTKSTQDAYPQKFKEETKLVNQIKDKLRKNKTLIKNADKGKRIGIIYPKDYDQKS